MNNDSMHRDEGALPGQHLYSPAMLADLLGVSVRLIRRWARSGLLPTASEVFQMPYFDYRGVATARQLARWARSGLTVAAVQQQLEALRERFGRDCPLDELPIVAEGKRLILQHGDVSIEANGQFLLLATHEQGVTLLDKLDANAVQSSLQTQQRESPSFWERLRRRSLPQKLPDDDTSPPPADPQQENPPSNPIPTQFEIVSDGQKPPTAP